MATTKSTTKKSRASRTAPAAIAGIPITRAELEPLFGKDEPRFAYIYSSTFTTALDPDAMRDAIAAHAAELRVMKQVTVHDYPPPDGTQVVVTFAKKMVAATIRRSTKPSRWQLTAHYRAAGEPWGSNHALFLWLEKTILPWLGAKSVKRGPWPHAHARHPG